MTSETAERADEIAASGAPRTPSMSHPHTGFDAKAGMLMSTIMNAPVERDSTRNYVPLSNVTGKVGLHDVGFSYPAAATSHAPASADGR